MNEKTTFLVAENSFLSGLSRVLDIASTRNKRIYNSSKTEKLADRRAILSDWQMIGNDVKEAYGKITKEAETSF